MIASFFTGTGFVIWYKFAFNMWFSGSIMRRHVDDSPCCQVFLVLLQQLSVLLQREVQVVVAVDIANGIV